MENCSSIKSNKTGSFVVMWMSIESVIQSKISQKRKTNIIYYIWNLER